MPGLDKILTAGTSLLETAQKVESTVSTVTETVTQVNDLASKLNGKGEDDESFLDVLGNAWTDLTATAGDLYDSAKDGVLDATAAVWYTDRDVKIAQFQEWLVGFGPLAPAYQRALTLGLIDADNDEDRYDQFVDLMRESANGMIGGAF